MKEEGRKTRGNGRKIYIYIYTFTEWKDNAAERKMVNGNICSQQLHPHNTAGSFLVPQLNGPAKIHGAEVAWKNYAVAPTPTDFTMRRSPRI